MHRSLLRYLFIAFLLVLITSATTQAQVNIVFPAISGSAGQTVTVPITLENVPANGFNSFQFDVKPSSGSLVFVKALRSGTITPGGWLWDSGATNSNDRVLAAGTSNSVVTQSGIIAYLEFQVVAVEAGVTVELQNFRLKLGSSNIPFTPAVPTSGLNASSSPVAGDDTYSVNEGATLTVSAANGVLMNDTDADNDALSATIGTSPTNGTVTLNSDGSFTYTHNDSETTSDSFTYSVSDGSTTDTGTVSITVNPVNDPPVFTAVMSDQTVDEGDLVSGTFTATDPEGSSVSYSISAGPAGSAISPTTGDFAYLATAGSAGVYTVTVSASDGTASASSSFELTIRNVEQYATVLSGIHQPVVNTSAASGSVEVTYDAASHDLVLSGSFSALSSFMDSAQLMMGTSSQAGTGVFNLTASLSGSGMSGTFAAASNTFDLDTAMLPAGVTLTMVENALRAGELFVNVRTLDRLDGELRGKLLPTSNGAPSAVAVSAPSSVTVTGEPSYQAYALTWTPGSDPDGHATKLVLDASGDILFSNYQSVTDVTAAAGSTVSVSVAEAAALFDALSGASAGSIPVGTTEIVYYRLRHTDGAVVSIGNPAGVVLTRGTVTDTEDASLPSEFVLKGNYPNPFNPSTTISFDLPETADVQVDVMDLLGRTMISVPSQNLGAGVNRSIAIDASELTSGIYMYRVLVRGVSQTWVKSGTMTLIK